MEFAAIAIHGDNARDGAEPSKERSLVASRQALHRCVPDKRCHCCLTFSRETAAAAYAGKLRPRKCQVRRGRCLTHRCFLENLTGETAIEFPAKAVRCYKFSANGIGFRQARMMPAMVRSTSVKTAIAQSDPVAAVRSNADGAVRAS